MPQRNFICEHCGWKTNGLFTNVGHPCPKNGKELTECFLLDGTPPVIIGCDGCDNEWFHDEWDVFTESVARKMANAEGWSCNNKTGDWCARCVAEGKNKAA